MQKHNYTFFYNIAFLVLYTCILFTLFVKSGQFADNNIIVKKEYFTSILFVINVVSIMFLAINRLLKFYLQDLLAIFFLLFTSVNQYYHGGIQESRYEMVLLLIILYFCFRVMFTIFDKCGRIFVISLLISGIAQSIVGIAQILEISHSYNSRFSITGTFFNPGPFSAFIALSFVLAVGVLSKIDYQSPKYLRSVQFWLALICTFLCGVIIPATMSRSAWISVVAVLIIIFLKETRFFLLFKDYLFKNRFKAGVGIFMAIIIAFSLFTGMYFFKRDSADGRVLIWKTTISLVKDNPVTGVGFGKFSGAYGDKQTEYFLTKDYSQKDLKVAGEPQYAFNDYLQIAAETGLPTLLIFLLFVLLVTKNLIKDRSLLLYPFLSFLIFSLTSYPLNVLPLSIIFVLLASISVSAEGPVILIKNKVANSVIFGLLLIMGLLFSGYQFLNKDEKYGTFKEWRGLQRLYEMQVYEGLPNDYALLYNKLKDQHKFLFEYGRTLNQVGSYTKSNEILYQGTKLSSDPMFYNVIGNNYKSMGLPLEAESAYKRAFNAVPNRLYPLYLLTKLYYDNNQIDKFNLYAHKVLNFVPKVTSSATKEMKQEIRQLLEKTEKGND